MNPYANALGRAMRGGESKKESLDPTQMEIIFGTIKKAYAILNLFMIFKNPMIGLNV
jgi:hypothetical protein